MEWVPVVQGGMSINSSKVKTRGLQHFHPLDNELAHIYAHNGKLESGCFCLINPTFLPLVENRRTGVVLALLFRVRKLLSTTLMDTLLSHFVEKMGFILHRLGLKVWSLYGRDRRKKKVKVSQALVGWELLEFKLLTTYHGDDDDAGNKAIYGLTAFLFRCGVAANFN